MGNDGYDRICEMDAANLNAEGNAHLLAAAAALLAVLEEAVEEAAHVSYCSAQCGPVSEGWLEEEKCDCFIKKAKRAISTAKGEGV